MTNKKFNEVSILYTVTFVRMTDQYHTGRTWRPDVAAFKRDVPQYHTAVKQPFLYYNHK